MKQQLTLFDELKELNRWLDEQLARAGVIDIGKQPVSQRQAETWIELAAMPALEFERRIKRLRRAGRVGDRCALWRIFESFAW